METGVGSGHAAWTPVFNHWNSTELMETRVGSGHAAWTPVFNHWNSTELMETGVGSGLAAWTPVFNHWNSTELMETGVGSGHVAWTPVFNHWNSTELMETGVGSAHLVQHDRCRVSACPLQASGSFVLWKPETQSSRSEIPLETDVKSEEQRKGNRNVFIVEQHFLYSITTRTGV
ncbi:hypothetical protein EOD39_0886 [Acipenser ruthenus]|uniref:Uncharacterized protein n=1 Tax=Acipenser ruthenus TaxID=7906 RepID=A0A444UKU8_ACIRT|nr:hypothetical protein EOD39_0886 [Acipenser ruthenus]